MKVLGIISEYNPFHSGHNFQIENAKKITGAEVVIAIMSGNFVQRGEPAVMNKWQRAECALNNGIDLVIELPCIYATASAEMFAMGGVRLADMLGIDYLSFGAESTDISQLERIAGFLSDESSEYQSILNEMLSSGDNFAKAREKALISCLGDEKIAHIISSPNNILAIEYLKAIIRNKSSIQPVIIKREGAGYNDLCTEAIHASASGIRELIKTGNFDNTPFLSAFTKALLKKEYKTTFPVFNNDTTSLLYYALLSNRDFMNFSDSNKNISDKIINAMKKYNFLSTDELIMKIKSREITHTRLSRVLCHILLGITNEMTNYVKCRNYPVYAHVLGLNESGKKFLNTIKKTKDIPVITRPGHDKNNIPENLQPIIDLDFRATKIFNLIIKNKFGSDLSDDFRTPPVISS